MSAAKEKPEILKEDQDKTLKSDVVQENDKTVLLKESEHKRLLAEAAEYKDKYLRLYAEFENARKRMERDKAEFLRYANQELLADFLDILDDLERSLEAAKAKHEDYDAFLKGIEMIMAHVYDLLRKNDVAPIEAKGKQFDPHCHEALMQEERDDVEEGVVVDEFQKGYMLGERVLRTNKVKVAKKKEQKSI
ncbi:MAG TPA: nucleotide exchange factor GrpE [Candidatus Omnitrophota bacterium]|nr:nucleotide exchange factor GrpE [Candidatus Omnitrophota bacterium]HQL41308.1 nucleotide exchange factor GrpE [Candidatus Omnitrophota bacterium]